jgi:hypothetical protein
MASQSSVRARVEFQSSQTPRSRVIIGDEGTAGMVDVTGGLIAAIAHALWQVRGGDEMTNWADAESALDQLFSETPASTRSEIKPPAPARAPAPVPAMSGGRKPGQRR